MFFDAVGLCRAEGIWGFGALSFGVEGLIESSW